MQPITAPHFLLLTQAHSQNQFSDSTSRNGVWKFVLEQIGSSRRIEITETEQGVWGERLQLLAVVRGLEALEQPSRVTLITPSRFVGIGIRSNLAVWKENHWQWEHFGEMIQIKNLDLWKRIDHAMSYHAIDCRVWDFELAASGEHQTNERRSHSPSQCIVPFRKRITFDEIQNIRDNNTDRRNGGSDREIPIKPMGRGRAFGLSLASCERSEASYIG